MAVTDIQVSIVMPVFNRSELIEGVIRSVQKQLVANWELIVVDDCSDDTTVDVIKTFIGDSRIRLLSRDKQLKGAPTCRNIGFSVSKGKFVIFWDSDDYMTPWCLKERVEFMNQYPDLDFALFQLLNYDKIKRVYSFRCDSSEGDQLARFLSYATSWGTHAVIWKRDSFSKLGGWNEQAKTWQDGEIHVRALAAGFRFKWGSYVPDGVIVSNSSENSITASVNLRERLPNRLEVVNSLADILPSEYQKTARRAARARIWYETQNAGIKDILEIGKSAHRAGFFSRLEKIGFCAVLGFYTVGKRVKGLRGLFYRLFLAPRFDTFIFFGQVRLDSTQIGLFREKLFGHYSKDSECIADFLPEPERSDLVSLLGKYSKDKSEKS